MQVRGRETRKQPGACLYIACKRCRTARGEQWHTSGAANASFLRITGRIGAAGRARLRGRGGAWGAVGGLYPPAHLPQPTY
jgi:hypothetical protein